MKISILLPFKKIFSPSYAGTVSLNINDILKFSKFRKNITVYGYTEYKKRFKNKYVNIETKKRLFKSQNKDYVNKFIELEKKNKSNIIELHNRPIYLKYLVNALQDRNYILYFHNDPLSMLGSKTINEKNLFVK